MTDANPPIKAVLLPGDGIGPEISDSVLKVFESLGNPVDVRVCEAGERAFEGPTGDALPEDTVAAIRERGLALKGPLATPKGGGYRSATVRMREALDLFANVRPAKTILPGRYDGIDILLSRETLEGLYVGREHYIRVGDDPHGVGVGIGINTKEGMRRFLRHSFDEAVRLGRKKVTVVHKANILKVLTGVFLEAAQELAPEYEGRIEIDDMIVDACAMNLVLRPERFDTIVTTNLFGDILSDLTAGLVGGLGLAPGANVGEKAAIFEAVHGTAPDIAGQGLANPTALLLAAAMLLEHAGRHDDARAIRDAVTTTIRDGNGTRDIGGPNGTAAFTDAVIDNLGGAR